MSKIIEITENVNEIAQISEQAKTILANEYGITINDASGIPTIVYSFLKAAGKYLADNKAPNSEVVLNLFNFMDVGISHEEVEGEKDGNYTPFATPGQEFKLIAKSDDSTED